MAVQTSFYMGQLLFEKRDSSLGHDLHEAVTGGRATPQAHVAALLDRQIVGLTAENRRLQVLLADAERRLRAAEAELRGYRFLGVAAQAGRAWAGKEGQ